jgi:serine protease
MNERKAPWPWIAFLLLALSAWPMLRDWQREAHSAQRPSTPSVANAGAFISPNQIEVQLRPGADDSTLEALSREIGAPFQWDSPLHEETEIAVATLPPGVSEAQALAKLRADGRVETADVVHYYTEPTSAVLPQELVAEEPSGPTPSPKEGASGWRPNDPRYDEQWNFRLIHAEEAWALSRGKGITVAVIDTGVAYTNCDKGPIARDFKQTRFVPGYDFANRSAIAYDDNGHGTHVAGTIAESTNNNEGVAGLAFDATIMPVKVLTGSGMGSSAWIAEGIRYAADHGANVINMSLGGPFPDKLMAEACDYAHSKGVVIVCAAGNTGTEGVGYPAAFKPCVAVSAVGPKGNLAFYSSYGRQIAIAAPGGDSRVGGPAGTILQNTIVRDASGNPVDDYYGFQGTSMASPHVAAVAALIEAAGIRNPDDVKCILQKSAQPKEPAKKYGAGILDAGRAVKLAINTYEDGVARFWFAMALFGLGGLVMWFNRKTGGPRNYPFWPIAAFAFGLLAPDWLSNTFGLGSHWNLLTHSVLIPAALLVLGADGPKERRFLGYMALGFTLHLGWEFLRDTIPVGLDYGRLALLPWCASNVLIGFGMLVSGLSAKQE